MAQLTTKQMLAVIELVGACVESKMFIPDEFDKPLLKTNQENLELAYLKKEHWNILVDLLEEECPWFDADDLKFEC